MTHTGRFPRLGRRGGGILLAVSIVIAATMTFAAPGGADPYGGATAGGWGELPNGPDHSYCFRSVASAPHRDLIHRAMMILDEQTEMTAVHHPTCTPTTDVAWVLGSWCQRSPSNPCDWMGLTLCETVLKWLATRVCDRSAVYIDLAVLAGLAAERGSTVGDPSYTLTLSSTMCHELGHTVGVEHYLTEGTEWGCMHSGWAPASGTADDLAYITYVPHHVDHINEYV